MDPGARKWLVAFFLAGVGLGAWLLSGVEAATAKPLSPVFLVVVPLHAVFAGAQLRAWFGARVRPLVWIRRSYGRDAEDSAVVIWCAVAAAIAGAGLSSLVPGSLRATRALLEYGMPVAAGILGFAAFGNRWTGPRRLLVFVLWPIGVPFFFVSFLLLFHRALLNADAYLLPKSPYWVHLGEPAVVVIAAAAAFRLALALHRRITGELLLPKRWFRRAARQVTSNSWRQIVAILSRAGFRQSGSSWLGPLGRGEACVSERHGRVVVQVSGFRSDVTLRAGVPGPPSVLRTGDEEFDGQVAVDGEPTVCFAAFVPAAREALLRVLDRFPSLHLAQGSLIAEGEVPAPRLLEALRELAAACEALGEPGNEGARILQILRTDPSPKVKARALDVLMNSSIVVPEEAARAALSDLPGPEVTLAAAFQLGPDGGSHLERLLGPASSQLLRARALDAIASRCDDETWAAAASRGLADPEANIRLGVLRSIGVRWLAGCEELATRALEDGDPRVRMESIALFVTRGMGDKQAALFPRLTDPDSGTRRAAIRALGSIGSPESIEKLVPVRTAGGEVGRLAADAIREIQARMPGGAHGQLSLSNDDHAGRLSAATESGSLSVAAEEATPAPSALPPQAKKLTS